MSAISCQKIISYKGIKIKVSKLSFDTLFILCSVEVAWSLNFLHSIQFGEKISYTSTKLMCSDFWWFLMNVISKYLFLEQFCQFSERVLKFLSKADGSLHPVSSEVADAYSQRVNSHYLIVELNIAAPHTKGISALFKLTLGKSSFWTEMEYACKLQ